VAPRDEAPEQAQPATPDEPTPASPPDAAEAQPHPAAGGPAAARAARLTRDPVCTSYG
jgi:hypothetical protein